MYSEQIHMVLYAHSEQIHTVLYAHRTDPHGSISTKQKMLTHTQLQKQCVSTLSR
jgi:hypothetical protein